MLAELLHHLADRRAILANRAHMIALLFQSGRFCPRGFKRSPIGYSAPVVLVGLLPQLGGNIGERRNHLTIWSTFCLPIRTISIRPTDRVNRRTRGRR